MLMGGPGGPPLGARNDRGGDMGGETLPPRFKKMGLNPGLPGGPNGGPMGPAALVDSRNKEMEVNLRPQMANNMLFKPKTPSMLPKSAISKTTDGSSPLGENSLLGPPLPSAPKVMMQQETPIMIKQGSLDKSKKDKNKGNKGPTRDEVFAKMDTILSELLEHKSTNESVESWKENNWLPSKMNQTAVTHFYKSMLVKEDQDRELALQFVSQLIKDGAINSTHTNEALSKILGQITDMEKDCGGLRSNIAGAVSFSIVEGLSSMKEAAESLSGGQKHPIYLQTLQRLQKSLGQEKLKSEFDSLASHGIHMVDFVPDESRSDENLAQLLEDYQLSFLMPLLSVQQDMSKQLATDPNPASFAKWIQETVNSDFHSQPDFVMTLFNVVVAHIVETTTLANGAADPTVQPDKATTEAEKEALSRFRSVLHPFVRDRPGLQLAGVYALQTFCHSKTFPKGLLLRLFVNFYELDIMEEQAFLRWKEDVNDAYPGKGKALFQVS